MNIADRTRRRPKVVLASTSSAKVSSAISDVILFEVIQQIAVSVESNNEVRQCNLSRVSRCNDAKSFRHRRCCVNNREIVIVFRADRPTTRRLAVYDAGIKMGICGVSRGELGLREG